MPGPRTAALLAELDPLPYQRRQRLLARRARELAAAGGLGPVLAELGSGDWFERQVALFMAIVAHDTEAVEVALRDPDGQIRRRATSAWLRLRPDATPIGELLDDAPAHARRQLYRLLRTADRPELADALIDRVRSRYGEGEAAQLLPSCTTATVARLLPELGHALGNRSALARRHPRVVLDDAARQLVGLIPPSRAAWWGWHGAGVLLAGAAEPLLALDVLERFAPATHLPGDLSRYGVLAAADPHRVLRLLTAPSRAAWAVRIYLPRALLDRFGRLAPADLIDLARRQRDNEAMLARLLEALPPHRRGELYDAATAGLDRSRDQLQQTTLDVLPRDRRIAEARRTLALGYVRDNENLSLHFTAFLSWEEAEPALTAATRRGKPEDRAYAYERSIECAARSRDPAVVSRMVASLVRLRNEQDPVRSRALTTLAKVAPGFLGPDTVEALDLIATDAVEARDSSSMTLGALSSLAVAVVRHHVATPPLLAWGLHTLDRLFGGDRVPWLGPLYAQLRRGQEREVFAAVRGWIEAGMARGRYEPLFAIARGLHRRAWRLPELQELLRQAVDPGNVSSVVRSGVSLWLADPSTRPERVEHVLRSDPSTVTLPEVWNALCSSRTDLLDRVLTDAPAGKFLPTGVRWVPGYAGHLQRWLPRQHRAYSDLVERQAADAGATIGSRISAISAAARIPGYGWALVQRYLDSPNTGLAEAALAALAWTDRPAEALPILLAHADGDRARVASYAAGRAARYVAPSQLYAALVDGPLTHGKVTSRKEAIRLLASLAVPGATDVLLDLWRREDQHRDVRAAVVSAARQRLEDPALWPILAEALRGSREEAMAALTARPFAVAETRRDRYAELVVVACGSSDHDVCIAGWTAFPHWTQWTPADGAVVVAGLANLDDRSTWRMITPVVTTLMEAGRGPVLLDVLQALVRLDAEDPTQADAERDRPACRRIDEVVSQLVGWARRADPTADRTALREAGRFLTRESDLVAEGTQLLTHATDLNREDPDWLAADLGTIADLLDGRPVGAGQVARNLQDRLAHDHQWYPDAVRAAAHRLLERADLVGGLFAVALATQGIRYGWPEPWRDLVRQLRRHRIADVRSAALAVVLAYE